MVSENQKGVIMAKISIIIPVYNAEKYLNKCLDSLINQTFNDIQIILVNDGSTDKSGEICDEYASNDSRIIVFHQNNSGPSSARNNGLKLVDSDWIMFVDADDWVELNMCEVTYNTAIQNSADMVIFNLCFEYGNKTVPQFSFKDNLKTFMGEEILSLQCRIVKRESDSCDNFLGVTGSSCKLFSSKVLGTIKFPLDITFAEDTCFNLQLLDNCNKIVYISDVFYHYRYGDSSLCHKFDVNLIDKIIRLDNWYFDYAQNKKETLFNQALDVYVLKNSLWVFGYYMTSTKKYDKKNITLALPYINTDLYRNANCKENIKKLSKRHKLLYFLYKRKLFFVLRYLYKIKNNAG